MTALFIAALSTLCAAIFIVFRAIARTANALALHAQPLDDAEQDGAEGAGWVSSFHYKEPSK